VSIRARQSQMAVVGSRQSVVGWTNAVQTKPICRGVARGTRDGGRVQTNPIGRRGLSCETRPIRAWGRNHRRDEMCKTNPICMPGEESAGQLPPCRRAQLRQTNPISSPASRQAGRRRRRMCGTKPIWWRIVRNKPNLHAERNRWGQRDPQRDLSRLGARPTLHVGTNAPNKPNSARPPGRLGPCEGQACQTKPISGRQDIPAFRYAMIPAFQPDAGCTNKANLPPAGRPAGFCVQTKPIRVTIPAEAGQRPCSGADRQVDSCEGERRYARPCKTHVRKGQT